MAASLPGKKLPTNAVLAFAVTLVNNKPQELTLREYFRLLHEHIARGRREEALSSRHFHLDKSSWWRSEYEREKALRSATEDENRGLKLKIDALKRDVESARLSSPTKKRKKVDEDVISVPRSPKRARQDASSSKRATATADAIADFDFTDVGETGDILMRSFYEINCILRSTQKTEPLILARECIRAASSVSEVVENVVQRLYSDPNNDLDELKSVLTATRRAILSLIMGINRLAHVADGAHGKNQVIYACVTMYARLVDVLSQASKSEVTKVTAQEASTSAKTKSLSESQGKQPTKTLNVKANPILSLLATFLSNIIDNLDSKIETHKSLFEGFTCVILSKLGSLLYTLVFGHERRETLELEISKATRQDEIVDSAELTPDEQSLQATKLEAPHLIHLLKRIMSLAPAHINELCNAKTGKRKKVVNRGSTKAVLAIAAKEKLQKTLINYIFGTEAVDADDSFMDCLKMPSVANTELPMPKVKETEVQDWFKAEVWRLLGWEILAREGNRQTEAVSLFYDCIRRCSEPAWEHLLQRDVKSASVS